MALQAEDRERSARRATRRQDADRVSARGLVGHGRAEAAPTFFLISSHTSVTNRGSVRIYQRNEQQWEKGCEEVGGFRPWNVGVARRGKLRLGRRERRPHARRSSSRSDRRHGEAHSAGSDRGDRRYGETAEPARGSESSACDADRDAAFGVCGGCAAGGPVLTAGVAACSW